jgi:hypothetical protein
MIGATPSTSITKENAPARSLGSYTSEMMAMEATMPELPPKAWRKRSNARVSRESDQAQPKLAATKSKSAHSSGFLRPYRSISGPKTNWPMVMPMK